MRISDQENQESGSENYVEPMDVHGVPTMKWSQGGDFTRNLLSLQLQLKTLLDGAGGDSAATLLDGLSQLSHTERARLIPIFSRVIARIVAGEKRLLSSEDKALQDFEDSLFDSVMTALGQSANDDEVNQDGAKPLEVVRGGKSAHPRRTVRRAVKAPSLVDLAKAREVRRNRLDSPPNEAS